jgi:D-alanyl-D-alanine carboxypeptidase (penicillin-binding protein 5/6)
MNLLAFFGVVTPFFISSLFQVQGDLINFIQNPHRPLSTLSVFGVAVEPVKNPGFVAPVLGAKAVLLIDKDSGKTLYSKNPHEKLPMASLTKIMTALVILDHQTDWDKVITVPSAATAVGGSSMHLYAGEQMTLKNLFQGMLIESGNDAAVTLAIDTAGSVDKFVLLMNQKAASLGLGSTHFINPHGYDADNHYTSAEDLAKMTRIALSNPIFADTVKIKKETVTDITGEHKHPLDNTNKLLNSYLNVIGVKTGTTSNAGESLVSSAVGDQGQTVIAVLLNSPDRFQEAKSALDWSLRAYSWVKPL